MTNRAMTIAMLCSHLGVGEEAAPLEPREYAALAARLRERQVDPEELLVFTRQDFAQRLDMTQEQTDRVLGLLERGESLGHVLRYYEGLGIFLVTRADPFYPKRLKEKLGNGCPPLFYAAGNAAILRRAAIGYAGSRTIGPEDLAFTRRTVEKTVAKGYGVVSGGAKGTDTAAEETALSAGGVVVSYLSDSLLRKLKKPSVLQAVQRGKLFLLSTQDPDGGFSTGAAMARNRYLYVHSEATLAVRADYRKGGTWNGAMDNLKHGWAIPLCWDNPAYPGNQALITQGAIPVAAAWDGQLRPAWEKQAQQLDLFQDL